MSEAVADLDAFGARCRAFLQRHATGNPEPGPDDPRGDEAMRRARRFQRALFDAGLAGLTVPVALGGQGLDAAHERVWREEAVRFPLMTEPLAVSLGNCLPLLLERGTDEQRQRHVHRLLAADEVCCQLFSEPGAGSDLAAVAARARRDGDGWRLDGQKVWTTYAHLAGIGILLARTDPAAPRHHGLSMFVVDLHAPGVEIRPIHQIDGARLFDEVFFTDVPVHAGALIPPEGDGWQHAVAMMHHQRLARGTSATGGATHERTDAVAAALGADARDDLVLRDRVAHLYVDEVVHALGAWRTRDELAAGQPPGPGGSVAKLRMALLAPEAADLAATVHGVATVAWEGGGGEPAREVVHARQYAIAGGTNEIQRNIIGERVLGLPK